MKTYLERFNTVVDEIKDHPLLHVVEYRINPPASQEVFDAVEQEIGAQLSMPMRRFYSEANGIKLHWQIKQDLSQKDLDKISKKYDDYSIELPENEDIPFAQIYLIPLEDCLLHRSWPEFEEARDDEKFEFAGVTYSYNDFGRRLRPFDLCSTYYCMAFFLEHGIGDPKVILLGDHYIEWDSSRITNFASYIEMLLTTRGIIDSREKIYSEYRGDLKPPLITGPDYWKKNHIPKLFRKKK